MHLVGFTVEKDLISRLHVTSDLLITSLKSVPHQPKSFLLEGCLDCNWIHTTPTCV